jgi:hypothetical protein
LFLIASTRASDFAVCAAATPLASAAPAEVSYIFIFLFGTDAAGVVVAARIVF